MNEKGQFIKINLIQDNNLPIYHIENRRNTLFLSIQ
jgi:hypothetical protein